MEPAESHKLDAKNLELLEFFIKKAESFLVEIREIPNKSSNGSDFLKECLLAVYSKQLRCLKACVLLCRNGLDHEALPVLRVIFYTYAYLKELEKASDKSEFARLWLLWSVLRKCNDIEQLKGLPDCPDGLCSSAGARLKRGLEEIAEPKKFLEYGPAKRGIKKIAQSVDLLSHYLTLFRVASSVEHGSDLTDHGSYQMPVVVGATSYFCDTAESIQNLLDGTELNTILEMRTIFENFQQGLRVRMSS